MHFETPRHPARHWESTSKPGRIQCNLCPRHCKMIEGQYGFCRVRGQADGALHTFNYGVSVSATLEYIETEAVYHYAPGARILSLGNIGCMMSCDFCQNWETSQVKHLNERVVRHYTPEQVVQTALDSGCGIISWTYNDPVVWHEFVLDTSLLAQKAGIKTLYKSAFYIEREPVDELLEVIDIFSLSLKSLAPAFYLKVSKAKLEPVLERIVQVHQSNRHLEISQLLIPELNDADEDVHNTVNWVVENLGTEVPLHFVGFHPAYKYLGVERTSLESLLRARQHALDAGIRNCYLGNVYRDGVSDTHCAHCDNLLVSRFGLTVQSSGLHEDGRCNQCGASSSIQLPQSGTAENRILLNPKTQRKLVWSGETNSIHVERPQADEGSTDVLIEHENGHREFFTLSNNLERAIVSRAGETDGAVTISWSDDSPLKILEVLDRAHFPVADDAELETTSNA
ncbi:MAG: AmmeMemoRadiSam system radical SAM enzyme [Roseibacillus sp.]|nr:AmmeMemoRadiSam system radical SAM enzyme [Roseibacillus sp.]